MHVNRNLNKSKESVRMQNREFTMTSHTQTVKRNQSSNPIKIKAYDTVSNRFVSWKNIKKQIAKKFTKKSDIVKVDHIQQKTAKLEALLNKDASVYFSRSEPVPYPINKNLPFIDVNIYIKEKEIFQNDIFWLNKGVESTKTKEVESAIDYYKQALRLNPMNFTAAYNLACEYEKLQSLSIAIEWYQY